MGTMLEAYGDQPLKKLVEDILPLSLRVGLALKSLHSLHVEKHLTVDQMRNQPIYNLTTPVSADKLQFATKKEQTRMFCHAYTKIMHVSLVLEVRAYVTEMCAVKVERLNIFVSAAFV